MEEKMDESKKNVSEQLKGVSQAILKMAQDIDKEEDKFIDTKKKC